MKRESNALFWAIGVLALIVASVGSIYIWTLQPAPPKPVFVSIGEVKAYAGNRRMVLATVTLEVAGKKIEAKVTERMTRTRTTIVGSFTEFSDTQLTTREGKVALQERIRDDLNELFGKNAIREVLFTSFVISIS
jgi:flagellar basal body-associated protein FliL